MSHGSRFFGEWKITSVCEEAEAVRGLFAQNGGVALLINCPHGEFHGIASFCSVPGSGLGVGVGHGLCPLATGTVSFPARK